MAWEFNTIIICNMLYNTEYFIYKFYNCVLFLPSAFTEKIKALRLRLKQLDDRTLPEYTKKIAKLETQFKEQKMYSILVLISYLYFDLTIGKRFLVSQYI